MFNRGLKLIIYYGNQSGRERSDKARKTNKVKG